MNEVFYRDVPDALAVQERAWERRQSNVRLARPWPLPGWPEDVPTCFLLCGDWLFRADWSRGAVRDRFGITADELDRGHCVQLSRPDELALRREGYRRRLL